MAEYMLNYQRLDPEAKWGFTGKKFTSVNTLWAFFHGMVMTGVFYAVLYFLRQHFQSQMLDMFFHGGPYNRSTIPYYTMFLTFWCLGFLFLKWRKLRVQTMALDIRITPPDAEMHISRMNVELILGEIHRCVYQSEQFMVLWRVERALGSLRNLGNVSEVSSILNDLAENDVNFVDSSYTLPKGLIWAIPVLGFIGTVLGLSQAVGGFGAVVSSGADINVLKGALGGVTAGLAVAFETTLIALIAALVVQLLMTLLVQKEEAFLDSCASYCYDNVTSRLTLFSASDNAVVPLEESL